MKYVFTITVNKELVVADVVVVAAPASVSQSSTSHTTSTPSARSSDHTYTRFALKSLVVEGAESGRQEGGKLAGGRRAD